MFNGSQERVHQSQSRPLRSSSSYTSIHKTYFNSNSQRRSSNPVPFNFSSSSTPSLRRPSSSQSSSNPINRSRHQSNLSEGALPPMLNSNMQISRPVAVLKPFTQEASAVMLHPTDTIESFKSNVANQLSLIVPAGRSLPLVDGRSGNLILKIEQIREAQWIRVEGTQDQRLEEIVGPPPKPFIGNIGELMGTDPKANVRNLFKTYSPLMKIVWPSGRGVTVVTDDADCVQALTDESRFFTKLVNPEGRMYWGVKQATGQGLFTASTHDPDWKRAHKILMPAFSAKAIRSYTSEMSSLALRCSSIFEKFASTKTFCEVSNFMTQLTLESVARCGFSYDFGLLDPNRMHAPSHPFVQAIKTVLKEVVSRTKRPEFVNHLKKAKFESNIQLMRMLVDEVIAKRKVDPKADEYKDMLQYMLTHSDPASGEALTDDNIRDNTLVFLIAGHETTSSLLSFCLFRIATIPEVEARIQAELKEIGITTTTEDLTIEQTKQLKYLDRVIYETLRLHAPVPVYSKWCTEDAVLTTSSTPGKAYKIKADQFVILAIDALHHNPKYWPDPEKFDPDRFLPENMAKRHSHAWLPFSGGMRGCIGRQFSMQETRIFLAIFLARFTFRAHKPEKVSYSATSGLTSQPTNLLMKIKKRKPERPPLTSTPTSTSSHTLESTASSVGNSLNKMPINGKAIPPSLKLDLEHTTSRSGSLTGISVSPGGQSSAISSLHNHASELMRTSSRTENRPLPYVRICFGSNSGQSEDFGHELDVVLQELGFESKVSSLDHFLASNEIEELRRKAQEAEEACNVPLVVFVSSTYNNLAPDNAARFDQYLTESKDDPTSWDGITYAVFGCGNSDWQSYQGFPSRLDSTLETMGAIRYFEKGSGDADDLEASWRQWTASLLSQLLSENSMSTKSTDPLIYGRSAGLKSVKVSFIEPTDERFEQSLSSARVACEAEVESLKELQGPKSSQGRKTLEVMVKLPEASGYEIGDHLEIWPQNETQLVRRLVAKLGLAPDAAFELQDRASLPPRSMGAAIKGPCTIENAFIHHADLLCPPPRSMLHLLADRLKETSPFNSMELRAAAEGDPRSPKSAEMRGGFLAQYPTVLDVIWNFGGEPLTFGDLLTSIPSMSSRRYSIASSPLISPQSARLVIRLVSRAISKNEVIEGQASGFFRRSQAGSPLRAIVKKTSFKPPSQGSDSSTILVCAGTGFAPFLGFLEHRQQLRKLSSTRPSDKMTLYFGCRDENDWLYKDRMNEWKEDGTLDALHVTMSRVKDGFSQYVGHTLLQNGLEIWKDREQVSFYVCGANTMAIDVRKSIDCIGTQLLSAPSTPVTAQQSHFRTGESSPEAQEILSDFETVQETQPIRPSRHRNWVPYLSQQNRYHEDVWGH